MNNEHDKCNDVKSEYEDCSHVKYKLEENEIKADTNEDLKTELYPWPCSPSDAPLNHQVPNKSQNEIHVPSKSQNETQVPIAESMEEQVMAIKYFPDDSEVDIMGCESAGDPNVAPIGVCFKCKKEFPTIADVLAHKKYCRKYKFRSSQGDTSTETNVVSNAGDYTNNCLNGADDMYVLQKEQQLVCHLCNVLFVSQSILTSHIISQHGEHLKSYKRCPQCKRQFENESKLVAHVHAHKCRSQNLQVNVCVICNKSFDGFNSLSQLNTHLISAHSNAQIADFVSCTYCKIEVRSGKDMANHLRFHCPFQPAVTQYKRRTKTICSPLKFKQLMQKRKKSNLSTIYKEISTSNVSKRKQQQLLKFYKKMTTAPPPLPVDGPPPRKSSRLLIKKTVHYGK